MVVLTWNVSKDANSLGLAIRHLCGHEAVPFIAVFQELPAGATTKDQAQAFIDGVVPNRIRCAGVIGPGRLGIFVSQDLTFGAVTADGNSRFAHVLIWFNRVAVHVVGVHAVDRMSVATDYGRRVTGVLLRQHVDACWSGREHLIVAGDFNADPYDPEICSRMGLFAVRDRDEVDRRWASPITPDGSQGLQPLYSPMWSLLPECQQGPQGTLFLSLPERGIRWRIYDQIVVSASLSRQIKNGPTILHMLAAVSLLTSDRTLVKGFSDHLPVRLVVEV